MMVLVGALALGAVASASASAARPEFNNRTSSAVKFSGESTGVVFEVAGGSKYSCTKATATGEIEPGKTKTMKNVVLTFKGCGFCNITTTTKPLTGTLGYIDQATKQVGLLLKPSSGPVAECAIPEVHKILGSIILPIGPVGKETTKLRLVAKQSKGVQEYTHFEGEAETHTLELEFLLHKPPLEACGLEFTELSLASEHAVEIEA